MRRKRQLLDWFRESLAAILGSLVRGYSLGGGLALHSAGDALWSACPSPSEYPKRVSESVSQSMIRWVMDEWVASEWASQLVGGGEVGERTSEWNESVGEWVNGWTRSICGINITRRLKWQSANEKQSQQMTSTEDRRKKWPESLKSTDDDSFLVMQLIGYGNVFPAFPRWQSWSRVLHMVDRVECYDRLVSADDPLDQLCLWRPRRLFDCSKDFATILHHLKIHQLAN